MVHRMEAPKFSPGFDKPFPEKIRVKPELDEYAGQEEDPAFSLSKRPRLDLSLQHCNPTPASLSLSPVPVEYNPLDEPSPLGLKLKKSPSFLDLIQMKLSQDKNTTTASLGKTLPRRDKLVLHSNKGSSASIDKLKASNFPATLLRIGTWEYNSRYEGDLVAKCYFAKHKLVWEVLDGGLKNKIEIQWSDIMAIRATCHDDGPETLDVLLARQPLFFREINPQPRKHTLWQATSDFTGGQATIYRRHFLQCSPGLLGKHFKKLIQCDPRLNFLSQQPEIVLDDPYFEPKHTMLSGLGNSLHAFDLKTENDDTIIDIRDTATSEVSGSEVERIDSVATSMELNSRRTPQLPADVFIMQGQAIEKLKRMDNLKILDQIKVPGLRPSMSMSDLVSHLGQCITEQIDPKFPINEEQKNSILEDIAYYLLSDSQVTPPTYDEKSIMSRVNSLCCLLQKEPISAGQDLKVKPEAGSAVEDPQSFFAFHGNSVIGDKIDKPESEKEKSVGGKLNGSTALSRKDSMGDFLLNLPRVASLPQFLFNFGDDSGNK